MNIRVRFSKHGCLKFIGHLDVMRYFQKAMRRAEIDMCYSEGFSPHMIMSFASPLGLGLESDGEYMDISVKQSPSSKEAVERLNAVMAEGIEVLSWRELPENSKNAMASVAGADYEVRFREGYELEEGWEKKLEEFLALPEIRIMKETKKGEQEVDIQSLPPVLPVQPVCVLSRFLHLHTFLFCRSAGQMRESPHRPNLRRLSAEAPVSSYERFLRIFSGKSSGL